MNASFSFNCWTAWSPPVPVWNTLVNMGISVDADYQDEGGYELRGHLSQRRGEDVGARD
jgi:hypothetical protein